MVYATVEVIVFAGLLGFQAFYPEERKRWRPIWILNLIAIAVSLTRMLWAVCWLLAGIELARRRSKWLWPVAALPVLLYGMAPGPVRSRIRGAMNPDYYPNQERIEMLRVGWRMIKKHPWIGVGPGRISELYLQYLQPHEPIPRYRGHLHNNLVQVASTFGLPVALAAILFVFALYRDLFIALRAARGREESFCCLTSLLALTGFLIAGVFDYTYGHSLALILLSFAVLSPFVSSADSACGINDSGCSGKSKFTWAWIAQVCGFREVVQ
jgi:O-antigen ligase